MSFQRLSELYRKAVFREIYPKIEVPSHSIMARPTMSLPDLKLADLRSHTEPLLVDSMATDKDNKYKASKTTYFAGLAAKPLVTIAILALIVFGLLELKIIVREAPHGLVE